MCSNGESSVENGDRPRTTNVRLVNLGCAKNVVDSEEMLGILQRDGYGIDAGSPGDVVVVNTCGFIEDARQESIDAILEAVEQKKRGDVRKVIVVGCLAQRYGKELARELPEVDVFLGVGQMSEISGVVGETLIRPDQIFRVPEKPHHQWLDVPTRVLSTLPASAYLKISEGCDHQCSFCAIPSFRGKHQSKPIDRVVMEAQLLAESGVRELNIIAQDTTQYGYDLCGRSMLPELLRALSEVDGVHWLRLFYCYPSRVDARVIEAIATTPKVCQYIDMPLQHADEDVLRAMRRPMSGAQYLDLLRRFREASPDVCIRTTFLVGFPGETEQQFENLLRFVEDAQFDRAGAFTFSPEDGTPAAELPGRLSERVCRERKDRLMRLQREISLERNKGWIGRELEVLVEEPTRSARGTAAGRSFRDAPEVDGRVWVKGTRAQAGEFIRVRVTDALHYDLKSRAVAADECCAAAADER